MLAFLLSPIGRIVAELVVAASLVAGAYFYGRHDGSAVERAAYEKTLADINAQNEAAIAAAVKAAQDKAEADEANLRQALDDLQKQKDAADAIDQAARDEIEKAGKSADKAAPDLILDAIRGASK